MQSLTSSLSPVGTIFRHELRGGLETALDSPIAHLLDHVDPRSESCLLKNSCKKQH